MDIGVCGIEPQHAVIVGDGAAGHVLALIGGATRDQRLDAVGLFRLSIVDQRAASRDRLVVVTREGGGEAERGIDAQILGRFDTGRRYALRKRDP